MYNILTNRVRALKIRNSSISAYNCFTSMPSESSLVPRPRPAFRCLRRAEGEPGNEAKYTEKRTSNEATSMLADI